ncbi:MAG: fatty acid desaturase, partial [Gammaproteobacteria bacterium]
MPPSHAAEPSTPALEWPTLLLLLACIAAWMALTAAWPLLPFWVVAPGVAVLLTLHSSLQHEILHGHPTRWRTLNHLLGNIPLSLWLPFARYRETHLAHHVNHRLTDPLRDPESNYWRAADWEALPGWQRAVVQLESTLAGRVLL